MLFLNSALLDHLGQRRSQTPVHSKESLTHGLPERSPVHRGEKSRLRQDQLSSYIHPGNKYLPNASSVPGSLGKLQ